MLASLTFTGMDLIYRSTLQRKHTSRQEKFSHQINVFLLYFKKIHEENLLVMYNQSIFPVQSVLSPLAEASPGCQLLSVSLH